MSNQAELPSHLQLLREREVASILNVSIYKVQRMRITGDGPKFCKIGGCVRYRLSDIQDYIENQTIRSTVDRI